MFIIRKSTLLLLGALVCLLAFLPLIYGHFQGNEQLVFTYTNATNAGDNLSYFSWIEQARQGRILLWDLYTTEQQESGIFNPLFLVMGWLAYFTDWSNSTIYVLFRLLATVALIFISYKFVGNFFKEKSWQVLAWLLLLLGGGFDWIFPMYIDTVFIPDFMVFHNLISSLLQCVSLGLILGGLHIFLSRLNNPSLKWLLVFVICLTLLVLIHPYSYITVIIVIGVYGLFQWFKNSNSNFFRHTLWALALSLPAWLWTAYIMGANPVFGIWAFSQSLVPSPEIYFTLASLGLFFGGGCLFMWLYGSGRIRSDRSVVLIVWFLGLLAMMYNPFFPNFARRFGQGIFIPFIISSVSVLAYYSDRLARYKHGRFVTVTAVAVLGFCSLLTTIFIITGEIYVASKTEYPSYISKSTEEALDWLKDNTDKHDKIMAGYYFGYLIPGATGRQSFIGHYDQTVNFVQKRALLREVLRQNILGKNIADPLPQFMKDNNLQYLVEDKEVRTMGKINIASGQLMLSYSNSEVAIYKLR